jgi:hypothetical protein
MDYSSFFEVADQLATTNTKKIHKLYYDEKGAILRISYDLLDGEYIEISENEYSMCHQKQNDYTVIDGKLEFTPPKQRTWNLTQDELRRNPYICNK